MGRKEDSECSTVLHFHSFINLSFMLSFCKCNKMMNQKCSWVCSICGEGFTRRTSARRHNSNLHSGEATIIRPSEYVIGRLNGQYSYPNDPLSYRRRTMNSNKVNNKGNRGTILPPYYHEDPNDSNFTDKKFGFGESLLSDPDLGTRSLMHPQDEDSSQPQYNTTAEKGSPSCDLHKLLERSSKLEELKILLNKHYPPKLARQLLIQFIFLLQDANDDKFLEDKLEWLRRVDKSQ
jgi:hypothetical protein